MRASGCCILLCAFLIAMPVAAGEEADQIIEHRVAGFRDIGTSFRNMTTELKSSRPSIAAVQSNARVISGYTAHIPGWFVPGSEPPAKPAKSWFASLRDWLFSPNTLAATDDVESHAKPQIWTQRAQFDTAYRNFKFEAETMVRTSQGTDIAAMKMQLRKLEHTCKACHDTFREDID